MAVRCGARQRAGAGPPACAARVRVSQGRGAAVMSWRCHGGQPGRAWEHCTENGRRAEGSQAESGERPRAAKAPAHSRRTACSLSATHRDPCPLEQARRPSGRCLAYSPAFLILSRKGSPNSIDKRNFRALGSDRSVRLLATSPTWLWPALPGRGTQRLAQNRSITAVPRMI